MCLPWFVSSRIYTGVHQLADANTMEIKYLKKYKHAPAHLVIDTFPYFITSGTYLKRHLFVSNKTKRLLLNIIQEILSKNSAELLAWVILSNHYHPMIDFKNPLLLPEIIKKTHSKSAVILNREERQQNRKVWHNYWDRCVRDEKDYFSKLNYIHFNPVKHGFVENPFEYEFSSYKYYLDKLGNDQLTEIITKHPWEKVNEKDDY
jgi:putative transposase